jgi:hypothetical protein
MKAILFAVATHNVTGNRAVTASWTAEQLADNPGRALEYIADMAERCKSHRNSILLTRLPASLAGEQE